MQQANMKSTKNNSDQYINIYYIKYIKMYILLNIFIIFKLNDLFNHKKLFYSFIVF
jgi:hypothetical protein